jgi:hypothetical protein
MKINVYISFYYLPIKLYSFWRTVLLRLFTFNKVNHVALIFEFPFANLTPFVLDGRKTKLTTEYVLERQGCVVLYKKYMGSTNMCVEDVKQIVDTQPITTWYKILFWLLITRWFGYKPNHCGTLATNWLNKTFGYSYDGSFPHKLMKEIKQ